MDLRTARAMRRKTQWDLRLAVGIHQSKISLFEHGYVEPTDQEKTAIADALGFEVNQIDWPEDVSNQRLEPSFS